MRFRDRRRAGEELAEAVVARLSQTPLHQGEPRVVRDEVAVLALPRGGVPVAAPVASALHAELDVLLVRKLGVPRNPDLAMGAVAGGGVRILNEDVVRELGISDAWIQQEVGAQTRELERRARRYRSDAPAAPVEGRAALIVDDGIATGATVRAAVRAVRARGATRVVVATPTAANDSVHTLQGEVEDVVCLHTPEPFRAVAVWYEHFPQVEDDEVVRTLERARREHGQAGPRPPPE